MEAYFAFLSDNDIPRSSKKNMFLIGLESMNLKGVNNTANVLARYCYSEDDRYAFWDSNSAYKYPFVQCQVHSNHFWDSFSFSGSTLGALMGKEMQLLVVGIVILLSICNDAAMAAKPRQPVSVPFDRNYMPSWSSHHIKLFHGGRKAELLLDKQSGTGFESKGTYLFGHFSMEIKLVGGDSAGTVTAYYLRSLTAEHDELDFEFLGNRSGQPYILQTNVFTGGKGDREHRIYLWFDPTKNYHSYSVLWNMYQIVFFVDDVPIRVFKNSKDLGVRYPFNQPMKMYSSLWNADDWATQGGKEKTDWSKAPFIASYRGFHIDGCEASVQESQCPTVGKRWWDQQEFRDLDGRQYRFLKWVRKYYTIYNYCTDRVRYPKLPPECTRDRDV